MREVNNKSILNLILIICIFTITIYKCLLGFDYTAFFTPGDPLSWKKLAIKLYELNIFAEEFPENNPFRSWRTPGFPFYLNIIKHLDLFNIPFLFFMNICFILSSLIFIFLVGKKFIKNSQILYLIILYCLALHIDTLSGVVQKNMNEALYFFLLSVSIYLILNKNNFISNIGYFILGLSVLVRTTILPLLIILLIAVIIFSFYKKKNFIKIKYFLVFIPAFLWMLRNYYVFGEFGYLIGANSDHLLLGTFKYVDWQYIDNVFNNIDTNGRSFEVIRSELRMKLAISRILDSPIQYFLYRMDVIIRHMYDHYAIIPLAISLFLFMKIKKYKIFISNNNLILLIALISFLFLLINSITIYNPRYGVISSFFMSYFLFIVIVKQFKEKNIKTIFKKISF